MPVGIARILTKAAQERQVAKRPITAGSALPALALTASADEAYTTRILLPGLVRVFVQCFPSQFPVKAWHEHETLAALVVGSMSLPEMFLTMASASTTSAKVPTLRRSTTESGACLRFPTSALLV